jgi:hypothetical protein
VKKRRADRWLSEGITVRVRTCPATGEDLRKGRCGVCGGSMADGLASGGIADELAKGEVRALELVAILEEVGVCSLSCWSAERVKRN